MKIHIKTVKTAIGDLDVEPTITIGDLKELISQQETIRKEHGEVTGASVSIILKSKMIKDNNLTLEAAGVKDGDNIVIVVKKAPASKPAPAPAPTTQPAEAPKPVEPTPSVPEPTPAPTQPATEPVNIFQGDQPSTAPKPVAEPSEGSIQMLVEMGIDRATAIKALKKANNNPEIAANFVLEGVDLDSLPDPGEERTSPSPSGGLDLGRKEDFIRAVQEAPEQFEHIFQQLERVNPAIGQLARSNPGVLYDILVQSTGGQQRSQPPPQSPSYQPAPAPYNPPEPSQPSGLQLSPADEQAINRLTELGFSRQQALQAYVAADKNEALAANLLLDGMI